MKKRVVLLVLFLIVISLISIAVQADIGDVAEGIEDTAEGIEDTVEDIEDVAENLQDEDYLASEWKRLIQENPITKGIDYVFTKMNVVFKVLFAQDYKLFSSIWFVIILWFIVALSVMELTQAQFEASGIISLFVGVLFAVGLAHLKIYFIIFLFVWNIIVWLDWWFLQLIAWIVIFSILAVVYSFFMSIGKSIRQKREKFEKQRVKRERKFLHTITEPFKNLGKG